MTNSFKRFENVKIIHLSNINFQFNFKIIILVDDVSVINTFLHSYTMIIKNVYYLKIVNLMVIRIKSVHNFVTSSRRVEVTVLSTLSIRMF